MAELVDRLLRPVLVAEYERVVREANDRIRKASKRLPPPD